MTLTTELLIRIAPQAHDPEAWAPALDTAAKRYGIDPGNRVNMWLAQLCHESQGLTRFVENLSYSAAGLIKTFGKYFPTHGEALKYERRPERIANKVYANRMGNGPEDSGDGWKYRGRGPIQRTGKAAYVHDGEKLNVDLLNFPQRMELPEIGSQAAALYWHENELNRLADRGTEEAFKQITKVINGGYNGWDDRKHWLDRIERIMKET